MSLFNRGGMNRGGDGVAVRDRKVARSNIPVKGGVVPGGRSSFVRDCFMIIMLPWRAASALRASAAGGPACAASSGLIVAGVGSCCDWSEAGAGGVPLLPLLI